MRRVVIATATTIISVGAVLGAAEAADLYTTRPPPLAAEAPPPAEEAPPPVAEVYGVAPYWRHDFSYHEYHRPYWHYSHPRSGWGYSHPRWGQWPHG